ncbi:all3515 family Zur-repressed PEP-CTERM protein [Microseira sp. BLCC-F43]|uniref:all3515 family Zur-repressed PEP-CTERM protein n=1 Tax=Microseira sp. BLCC-F43 TaxID=3153602 RepID=UPI0035B79F7E
MVRNSPRLGVICAGFERQKSGLIGIGLLLSVPLAAGIAVAPALAEDTGPGYEFDPGQEFPEFYIGVDGQETLTRGIYAGLPNPNYNRLTFLFAHREDDPLTNHFHGIGTYSYSGPFSSPTINPTNTNNRIPETYTGLPPLKLVPGEGIYQGRLITIPSGEEYSNLRMKPVAALNKSSEIGEQILFNSSLGRWKGSLADAEIALELVAITEGLNIANPLGVDILKNVGDTYTIGRRDDFSFLPTFWLGAGAKPGKYSATFKLLDVGTTEGSTAFQESGTFNLDFEKVPEPSTVLGLGLLGLMAVMRSLAQKAS